MTRIQAPRHDGATKIEGKGVPGRLQCAECMVPLFQSFVLAWGQLLSFFMLLKCGMLAGVGLSHRRRRRRRRCTGRERCRQPGPLNTTRRAHLIGVAHDVGTLGEESNSGCRTKPGGSDGGSGGCSGEARRTDGG